MSNSVMTGVTNDRSTPIEDGNSIIDANYASGRIFSLFFSKI